MAERLIAQGREVSTVEGVRVNKADGWWMCRNSSTSPQMTVRCEALSEAGLEECKKELEDDEIVVYSYSGENWNDGGKSKSL